MDTQSFLVDYSDRAEVAMAEFRRLLRKLQAVDLPRLEAMYIELPLGLDILNARTMFIWMEPSLRERKLARMRALRAIPFPLRGAAA